jgi:2-polyprenyl-6-methoxyphenol hydroxylase-like FAD-dependent oxidoreductase
MHSHASKCWHLFPPSPQRPDAMTDIDDPEAGKVFEFDVLVVGAGAAGVCAAHVMNTLGLRVALVDSRSQTAPCFKAEKLEPDQIALLREMNLLRLLDDVLSPIGEVVVHRRRAIVERLHIDQFGMHYHAFVNALRAGLPPAVTQFTDTVSALQLSDDHQIARLSKSGTVKARLIVVATGTSSRLRHALQATRQEIAGHHAVAFGFDLSLQNRQLPHAGVNFLPDRVSDRVGFLTLFPTPTGVRANLFAYQEPQSAWTREMRLNTSAMLERTFSCMRDVVGACEVTGRVEAASIDLWTTNSRPDPGVVLIGDAFQSVCPSTGTGLSKVLTDVQVLGQRVTGWLREPGMSAAKLSSYYESQEKQASDQRSLESAFYGKRVATDRSLRFRLTRLRRDGFGPWRMSATKMC